MGTLRTITVTEDRTIAGLHQGSVIVERGTLTIAGTVQGSLTLANDSAAVIRGQHQGSVRVPGGAEVVVVGSLQGSCDVAPGGVVIVESTGKMAGSLHNNGAVTVRGVFGGTVSGGRDIELEGSGHIKQPTIRHGVHYYEW